MRKLYYVAGVVTGEVAQGVEHFPVVDRVTLYDEGTAPAGQGLHRLLIGKLLTDPPPARSVTDVGGPFGPEGPLSPPHELGPVLKKAVAFHPPGAIGEQLERLAVAFLWCRHVHQFAAIAGCARSCLQALTDAIRPVEVGSLKSDRSGRSAARGRRP